MALALTSGRRSSSSTSNSSSGGGGGSRLVLFSLPSFSLLPELRVHVVAARAVADSGDTDFDPYAVLSFGGCPRTSRADLSCGARALRTAHCALRPALCWPGLACAGLQWALL